ncbi:ABC transporter ATP-binding protein/permease [Enterovirga rhinocerotis]|uniref:ABC transporter ATP-binding protein/permease n=1 Tax=Enterovirga rhinocerotis TaxID=1339210 RepID=UPI001414E4BC|nr:ABC transporter ATP-binding protein/permease [Enterovirga rhinocerotis]
MRPADPASEGAEPASSASPSPIATARSFFRIAGGFWQGETARTAWWLCAIVFALVLVNLAVALLLNRWNKFFFDAIERKDVANVGLGVVLVLGLALAAAAVAVGMVHARMRLQLAWRRWLTRSILKRWLSERRFYQLTIVAREGSHPEFRIADDVRLAIEPLVDFAIGLVNAILAAAAFFGVLWLVGGSIRLGPVTVPGYMVVAAVLYATLTSTAMVFVGRPLIQKVERKNTGEARFRYELTRVRESAESIALVGGDDDERGRLEETFSDLAARWLRVIVQQAHMTWISNANSVLAPVVPLLLGAPKYLAGDLSLGELMQIATAFTQVQIALNWLIDNAVRLAETLASAQRVVGLTDALAELDTSIGSYGAKGIVVLGDSPDDAIHIENLSLTQQNGTLMIEGASTRIGKGEKVLVKGESGTGKSTLIRAMAGLWPWGSGRILRPRGAEVAFMPQRPYLPLGTLRHVLLYPKSDESRVSGARILHVLREVGLSHLAGRLDEEDQWDQILSGGERQRIAFARVLLNPPDIIIMDEATSALGEVSQAKMMAFLHTELAEATVLSVGHRPGLEEYHDREIYLVREDDAASSRAEHRAYPGLTRFWRILKGERNEAP